MKIPKLKLTVIDKVPFAERPEVRSVQEAVDILRPFFAEDMQLREVSYAILLNRKMRVLGVTEVSKGGLGSTTLSARYVAQVALKANAACVIIAHNHPSNKPDPSESDNHVTKKLKEAMMLIECTLSDHIILTKESFYSYANEGIL